QLHKACSFSVSMSCIPTEVDKVLTFRCWFVVFATHVSRPTCNVWVPRQHCRVAAPALSNTKKSLSSRREFSVTKLQANASLESPSLGPHLIRLQRGMSFAVC